MKGLGLTARTIVLLVTLIIPTICSVNAVSAQSLATVKIETSTTASLGESFVVTIAVVNVNNLYGLEIVLNWDPAILQATNVDLRLGVESHSDGVLHENPSSRSVFIAENNLTQARGEYRLVATAMAPAAPFSGSGNIVKITFKPTSLGNSALDLESELSDYPPTDRDPRVSLPIEHITQDSSITVVNAISTPSSTISTSEPRLIPKPTGDNTQPPTSKPTTSTLSILESFAPQLAIIIAALLLVICLALLAIRHRIIKARSLPSSNN